MSIALILLVAFGAAVGAGAEVPAPLPAASSISRSPSTSALPAIEIAIAAAGSTGATSVREDLEELLARRGVVARYRRLEAIDRDEVVRPVSESACTLACIWIDLGVATPDRAFVYISATTSEQVVIRTLPLPRGLDEVAREEVSHIVATSIEALQAGAPLPVVANRASVAVAKVKRTAPPPDQGPRGTWISAGLGAGAAREAAGRLALPTMRVSLLIGPEQRRFAPALWLEAAGFASQASGEPVALRFRGGELAALAALGTSAHARAVARLGVGPGLEMRATTAALAGGGENGQVALDSTQVDPTVFIRIAARFEYHLFARIGLFAVLACDARIMSHRYTIENQGTTQAVFQPDRFRPSVGIGVDGLLLGEGTQ